MQSSTKRAVIIKNPSSPYISEAIIFINENMSIKEEKILTEADRIINEYIKGYKFITDTYPKHSEEDVCLYKKGSLKETKKTHRQRKRLILSLAIALIGLCVYGLFYKFSR